MSLLRKVWIALLAVVVATGVACFVMPHQSGPPQQLFLTWLGFSAVLEAAASIVLPSILLPRAFARFDAKTVKRRAPPGESAMFGVAPGTQRVFKRPKRALRMGLACYQPSFIVGLALGESVAIDGIMLSKLGFPASDCLPFVVAGFMLVAVRYPVEKRILALIERHGGARFPAEAG